MWEKITLYEIEGCDRICIRKSYVEVEHGGDRNYGEISCAGG